MNPDEIAKRRAEFKELTAKRMKLTMASVAATNSGNKELGDKLYREMMALDPEYCEHDRSWASTCHLCDQIHMECFPEYYGQCEVCKDFVDKDELENNRCFDCVGSESE